MTGEAQVCACPRTESSGERGRSPYAEESRMRRGQRCTISGTHSLHQLHGTEGRGPRLCETKPISGWWKRRLNAAQEEGHENSGLLLGRAKQS